MINYIVPAIVLLLQIVVVTHQFKVSKNETRKLSAAERRDHRKSNIKIFIASATLSLIAFGLTVYQSKAADHTARELMNWTKGSNDFPEMNMWWSPAKQNTFLVTATNLSDLPVREVTVHILRGPEMFVDTQRKMFESAPWNLHNENGKHLSGIQGVDLDRFSLPAHAKDVRVGVIEGLLEGGKDFGRYDFSLEITTDAGRKNVSIMFAWDPSQNIWIYSVNGKNLLNDPLNKSGTTLDPLAKFRLHK